MLKPASESNPEYVHPWSSIANRLSTTEYEDLTVHDTVGIFDGKCTSNLPLLVMPRLSLSLFLSLSLSLRVAVVSGALSERLRVITALAQLAMETPTVRQYMDDVAEREEDWSVFSFFFL